MPPPSLASRPAYQPAARFLRKDMHFRDGIPRFDYTTVVGSGRPRPLTVRERVAIFCKRVAEVERILEKKDRDLSPDQYAEIVETFEQLKVEFECEKGDL